jgi:predicted glycoside hydrolase/deacetylase ChbG (UPF0249 family)
MPRSQPLDRRQRCLVVNADDFGQSRGINRGIIECHHRGIVTSTSLMVTGRAVEQAAVLAREHPELAVGLHFDVWGEDEREFDTRNLDATHDEFHRQLERFVEVMDRLPTHIDSHRHAHREPHLFAPFQAWAAPLEVPVRGAAGVNFVGGFYAQWEWRVTDLRYVSVPFLSGMLRNEVPAGVTEFSCHPGYLTADYSGIYAREREAEIATLTDPRIRQILEQERIRLISFADCAEGG